MQRPPAMTERSRSRRSVQSMVLSLMRFVKAVALGESRLRVDAGFAARHRTGARSSVLVLRSPLAFQCLELFLELRQFDHQRAIGLLLGGLLLHLFPAQRGVLGG